MNVLYIGATGLVGSHVVPLLSDKFDFTLAALHAGEFAGKKVLSLNVADWESTEKIIANGTAEGKPFDAVVYCATANFHGLNHHNPDQVHRYFEQCIEVNARGAYHVFEAASRAQVPRVVHVGSITTVLGQPRYEAIDQNSRDRPRDLYAATKTFGENVGRSYAYSPWRHGRQDNSSPQMQVICLRLGMPIPKEEWAERPPQYRSNTRVSVTMEDLAQAVELALTTDVEYGVYPIVSEFENPFVAPSAYEELGYKPQWHFDSDGVYPVESLQD